MITMEQGHVRKAMRLALVFAATAASTFAASGPAHAEAPASPTTQADVQCGSVELTFVNPTTQIYVFDYRIDGEAPVTADDAGDLWHVTAVDGQHEATKTVTFDEDSGEHLVEYRVARGGEDEPGYPQDWQSAAVETDCEPNPPAADAENRSDPCAAYAGSEAWCDPSVEDYNCADIPDVHKPIDVVDPADDPYQLDAMGVGDGIGCESEGPPGGNDDGAQPAEDPGDENVPADDDDPAAPETLPNTGAGSLPLIFVAVALLCGGAAVVIRRSEPRSH